jgi:hypothetical protein
MEIEETKLDAQQEQLVIPIIIDVSDDVKYTESDMIDFAKYVWYNKSLKYIEKGLVDYFREWLNKKIIYNQQRL